MTRTMRSVRQSNHTLLYRINANQEYLKKLRNYNETIQNEQVNIIN